MSSGSLRGPTAAFTLRRWIAAVQCQVKSVVVVGRALVGSVRHGRWRILIAEGIAVVRPPGPAAADFLTRPEEHRAVAAAARAGPRVRFRTRRTLVRWCVATHHGEGIVSCLSAAQSRARSPEVTRCRAQAICRAWHRRDQLTRNTDGGWSEQHGCCAAPFRR